MLDPAAALALHSGRDNRTHDQCGVYAVARPRLGRGAPRPQHWSGSAHGSDTKWLDRSRRSMTPTRPASSLPPIGLWCKQLAFGTWRPHCFGPRHAACFALLNGVASPQLFSRICCKWAPAALTCVLNSHSAARRTLACGTAVLTTCLCRRVGETLWAECLCEHTTRASHRVVNAYTNVVRTYDISPSLSLPVC